MERDDRCTAVTAPDHHGAVIRAGVQVVPVNCEGPYPCGLSSEHSGAGPCPLLPHGNGLVTGTGVEVVTVHRQGTHPC